MPEQSIYEYIRENIVDGALPADFNLYAYDNGDSPVPFVDGARDGITVFHTAGSELPETIAETIAEGIAHVCADDYEAADEVFAALGNEHRVIALIDPLQHYVMDNSESIDPNALSRYVQHLLKETTDKELVKIGLSLQELFGEPTYREKQVVRTLGLSDEFTLFAAWCARNWNNANDELFDMAKKAEGWGRIHVVEMLKPETDEIYEWLLYSGAHNTVMPEYSALTCYEKASVVGRLGRKMGHHEFSAISFLVTTALADGPVAGIASHENPKAELAQYVVQAARQPLDAADRACLEAISQFATAQGWDDLAADCATQLSRATE